MIPQEFVDTYNLKGKAHNRYIFARVTKWMYGLPQAVQIAHDDLFQHMEPYGYRLSRNTPVPWKHESRPTNFNLLVDNFGVKYLVKEHILHLKAELEDKYKVTTDWEGKL